MQRRAQLDQVEDECFAALLAEYERFHGRVAVIEARGLFWLADAEARFHGAFAQMEKDMEERATRERCAVTALEAQARAVIERKQPLVVSLRLEDDGYQIDYDTLLFELPVPQPPVLIERPHAQQFTIEWLTSLSRQLAATCPIAVAPVARLSQLMVQQLLTYDTRCILPQSWRQIEGTELRTHVLQKLSPDGCYLDWRSLVLSLCSLPPASLATLRDYRARLQASSEAGLLSTRDFVSIPTWFEPWWVTASTDSEDAAAADEPVAAQGRSFNRGLAMKILLAELFAGQAAGTVNVTDMLLHLCRGSPPSAFWDTVELASPLTVAPAGRVLVTASALFRVLHLDRPGLDDATGAPTTLRALHELVGEGMPLEELKASGSAQSGALAQAAAQSQRRVVRKMFFLSFSLFRLLVVGVINRPHSTNAQSLPYAGWRGMELSGCIKYHGKRQLAPPSSVLLCPTKENPSKASHTRTLSYSNERNTKCQKEK